NSAVFIPGPGAPMIGPFPLPPQTVGSFASTLGSTPDGPSINPVPGIDIPPAIVVVEDEPVGPEPREPEEEQVVERPTIDCPVTDGIPITDGGIILDGDPDQIFDDFGTPEFGLDCVE
ncbi:MAG: hypothetical protein AAGA69_07695, partial [Pseudomonadota bacterium]